MSIHGWRQRLNPRVTMPPSDDVITIATESIFLVLLVIFTITSSLYPTIMQNVEWGLRLTLQNVQRPPGIHNSMQR
jgi:hypothetical protein